jgi:uncharacterized membrane protein
MLNERLFLVRPLIIALALGCAGALLSALEEAVPGLSAWAPTVLFPSQADPQVAQVVLATIATSMMTVVSIVFAVLLMTLTLASMQFSPRIIVSFARDHVTQRTLGIFLGTFSYCVAALPAARSVPRPFVPVLTVMGAMLLALACVAGLLFFIHHISQAIGVNHIVEKIATETAAIIDGIMREPRRRSRRLEAGLPEPCEREGAVSSDVSGYVRFIDIDRLVFLAKSYGVMVRIVRRVGHFVPAGVPLLMVSKGDRLSSDRSAELRGAFDLGPTRTLQQDIEFGILQIVDIALRAISPAVNDPSTAINCVDQLSRGDHPRPRCSTDPRRARAAHRRGLRRGARRGGGREAAPPPVGVGEARQLPGVALNARALPYRGARCRSLELIGGTCEGGGRGIQQGLHRILTRRGGTRRHLVPRRRRRSPEHPSHRALERLVHGDPVPEADDHPLELRELPLLGGDVERFDIHKGALDRDDQEVPPDHLGASLVPESELLGDE